MKSDEISSSVVFLCLTLFSFFLLIHWWLLDLLLLQAWVVKFFLLPTICGGPPAFEVGVEPLQDVDGVVDDQCQPCQAEEDP